MRMTAPTAQSPLKAASLPSNDRRFLLRGRALRTRGNADVPGKVSGTPLLRGSENAGGESMIDVRIPKALSDVAASPASATSLERATSLEVPTSRERAHSPECANSLECAS
jgi:hypothetical protein